jgi:hypothetical protein
MENLVAKNKVHYIDILKNCGGYNLKVKQIQYTEKNILYVIFSNGMRTKLDCNTLTQYTDYKNSPITNENKNEIGGYYFED